MCSSDLLVRWLVFLYCLVVWSFVYWIRFETLTFRLEKIGRLKKDGLYVATVGYPVGMPGSTNTIKILTPSEMDYYLNFKSSKDKEVKEKKELKAKKLDKKSK